MWSVEAQEELGKDKTFLCGVYWKKVGEWNIAWNIFDSGPALSTIHDGICGGVSGGGGCAGEVLSVRGASLGTS